MYYKDENESLICIQATFGKSYAKKVSAYEKFYAAIGISPEETKMNLFYFTFPRNIDEYTKESNVESTFWKGVKELIQNGKIILYSMP